jgi:hypothetical protein
MRINSTIFAILTAARLASGQSPPSIFPQVLNLLLVNYGGTFIQQGKVVSQSGKTRKTVKISHE